MTWEIHQGDARNMHSYPDDDVLDPFAGSGTTLEVADILGRHGIGIEKSAKYIGMATERLEEDS